MTDEELRKQRTTRAREILSEINMQFMAESHDFCPASEDDPLPNQVVGRYLLVQESACKNTDMWAYFCSNLAMAERLTNDEDWYFHTLYDLDQDDYASPLDVSVNRTVTITLLEKSHGQTH